MNGLFGKLLAPMVASIASLLAIGGRISYGFRELDHEATNSEYRAYRLKYAKIQFRPQPESMRCEDVPHLASDGKTQTIGRICVTKFVKVQISSLDGI
jgi:hypothetical protein